MKRLLSGVLVAVVAISGLFLMTGCEKGGATKADKNKTDVSYTLGKGKVTFSVPKKDDGTAKYEFTTTKPEGMGVSATAYLETDTAILGISTSGLSYNTSAAYKAKYGDTKASFAGYLEFIEDSELFNKKINLPGLEQFEINGRKALRYYSRVGSSGNYEYRGYFYAVGVDDIYPGSRFGIIVYHKGEFPKEAKEFNQETLDIIKSLKIEANA